MKKLLILACFGIYFFNNLSAQKLDFKYSLDSIKVENTYKFKVTVTIFKGEGPYTYFLFKGEPWKGGEIYEQSAENSSTTYTFEKFIIGDNFHVGVKGLTNQDVMWKYINLKEQK